MNIFPFNSFYGDYWMGTDKLYMITDEKWVFTILINDLEYTVVSKSIERLIVFYKVYKLSPKAYKYAITEFMPNLEGDRILKVVVI